VYVHGLFMDGAAWGGGSIVESENKKLFSALPVILVSAISKAKQKGNASNSDYGPFGGYECPVYKVLIYSLTHLTIYSLTHLTTKYPTRTDKYLIFTVTLPSMEQKPLHWILRGVCLLCTTS
jgi:dynein heavy chain